MVRIPALCLNISGCPAPSGKLSTTLETELLTSFVTSSKSKLVSNVRVILELSSSLNESTVSRPGVPATKSSIFCVICVSTISAEAPLYSVCIVTIGGCLIYF